MRSPARICIVSEILYPEDRGGQGRQAFDLARALHAAGRNVRILTRRHFAQSRPRERMDGVAVTRVPPLGIHKGGGWRVLLPTLIFMLALTWHLLRGAFRYRIVLVHGVKLTVFPPMLMKLLFGTRVIVKVDATDEVENAITAESLARMGMRSDSWLMRTWTHVRRSMLTHADAVVAISDQVRAALLRVGVPASRIVDIPNGIDFTRWHSVDAATRTELRARLALPAGPLFICVGRLSRAKGVVELLNAWFALCETNRDAHLLIVGSGVVSHDDCEQELRALHASSPHPDRVTFVGQVENVPDYLQASDVFVQCSEHEGFGLALAEAMGCALPCITTPVGFAPDVIDNGVNGVLVPIRDQQALTAAMNAVLAHRDCWSAMGTAGRDAVIARYDLQQVAARYLQLFDRDVRSESRPQPTLSEVRR